MMPERVERDAAIVVGLGIGGTDRQDPVVADRRITVASERRACEGAAVQRLAIERPDRERLVEARHCLLVASEVLQHQTAIAQRVGRARIALERSAEHIYCFGGPPLLMADDGEQVAGIDVVGARLEDVAAQALSFGQPPFPLTGGSAIQRLGQAQQACSWRCL